MAQVEVVALELWLAENPEVDAKALSNRLARLERGVDVDYLSLIHISEPTRPY